MPSGNGWRTSTFRLYFMGEVGRPDLASRFGVAPAGGTRDLALYREIAPQNIVFDGSSKVYRIGKAFISGGSSTRQRVFCRCWPTGLVMVWR